MRKLRASDTRSTVQSMRATVLRGSTLALSLVLVSLVLAVAGCGGGGGGAAAEETTDTETTVTETVETDPVETDTTGGTGTSTIEDTDGSYSGNSPICKAVTNSSSPLNIAASTGDFPTVSAEWAKLAPAAPAAIKADVETVSEGYGKVPTDPAGFGVLETEPYKTSLAAVNAWTTTNCAQ
jgi:hypothetical protein